jgi:Putative Actinobacterial Holin-X, holin superfamily III
MYRPAHLGEPVGSGEAEMAQRTAAADRVNLEHLLGDLVRDGRHLLEQQFDLFRTEASVVLRRSGEVAGAVTAGGGLMAAGGVLAGLSGAHLLHRATGLPLWACFGVTGAALAASGVRLVRAGRERAAAVRPFPQSAAALGENLAWLTNQLAAPAR